jgi:hypothetical protein
LVTGDPTTTIEDLLRNSPDRKQLEELSDAELLRKAAREVLIAVCLAARALMLKPTLVLTKPAEVGVLMRALAECYRAATVALAMASVTGDGTRELVRPGAGGMSWAYGATVLGAQQASVRSARHL